MLNSSRRTNKNSWHRGNASYASLFKKHSWGNPSDMTDSHDLRTKHSKTFKNTGEVNNSEFRAAINRRQGFSLSPPPLPRLRSEVPLKSTLTTDSQVNTFLPKYFKQQKGRNSNLSKSRSSGTNNSQSKGTKSINNMRNLENGRFTSRNSQGSEGLSGNREGSGTRTGDSSPPDLSLLNPAGSNSDSSTPDKSSSITTGQATHQVTQHDSPLPPPPPPPPPPPENNISLADIMLRLNSLAELPGKINDMANDLKQMRILQEQTAKMGQEIREVQGRVDKIDDKIEVIQDNETETQQNQELLAKEISDLKVVVQKLQQEAQVPPAPPTLPQAELDFFKAKVEALVRKNNLIIEGIREAQVEKEYSAFNQARYFVKNTLGLRYAEIGMAYRLGKPRNGNSQPRPMFIHFPNLGDRMDVWNARPRYNTRDFPYTIREDLPQQLRPIQAALQRVAQVARRHPQKFSNIFIRDFRIYVNDSSYGIDELENLPKDLRPSVSSTPGNQQVVVFFGKESKFSNHHHSKFTIQETTYSSIEQYLADKRATLAERQDLRDRAMASDNPVEAKRVLNALHGDKSDEQWVIQRKDILFDGLMAKFQQNDELKKYLLSSEQRRLGEASRNKEWGIGLTLADSGRLNPRNWTGENLLGSTLMEVRDRLTELARQPSGNPTEETPAQS